MKFFASSCLLLLCVLGLNGQTPSVPIVEAETESETAEMERAADDEFSADDPDQESKDPDSSKVAPVEKFNRRVMLMVFINESKDKDKEYLSISVADAFSGPLTKTGHFVILNRNSVERYMKVMGIPHADIYKEENATRLGRAIGADVVVVGKFVTNGDSVTIEAKAVDVQAGRMSVQDSEQIKTNATMFNAINKLAERMSGPMAEKMQPLEVPPPPAEVVLTEEQVVAEVKKIEEKKVQAKSTDTATATKEQRLYLEPGISLLQAPGVTGNQISYDGRYPFGALNPGIYGALVYESTLPEWKFLSPLGFFHYTAALEYAYYSAAFEILSSTGPTLIDSEAMRLQTAGLSLSLAHAFPVWSFTLTPYAGFSMDYVIFSASKSETLYSGMVPGAHLGCRWRIYEWQAFEIGINWRSGIRFLNDSNNYLNHTISVSGGYRL
jgi:TolB-like protein